MDWATASRTANSIATRYLLDLQPGLVKVLTQTVETDPNTTTRFVHGPRGILAHEDSAGNWSWMVQDGLGSVRGEVSDSVAVGSKAPAADEELRQLRELRAQGLSFVKIGARLGYSQGWVMQNLRQMQNHRSTLAEREQTRKERIAEAQALLDQGMKLRNIAVELGTSYNTVRRLLGKC